MKIKYKYDIFFKHTVYLIIICPILLKDNHNFGHIVDPFLSTLDSFLKLKGP